MLRPPPILRGVITNSILRRSAFPVAQHSRILASRRWSTLRHHWKVQNPKSRCYATSSVDPIQNHDDDGVPLPTCSEYHGRKDAIVSDAAVKLVEGLLERGLDIDDRAYDAMEKEILLHCLRQVAVRERRVDQLKNLQRSHSRALAAPHPVNELRRLTVAQRDMPQSLREKALTRLGPESQATERLSDNTPESIEKDMLLEFLGRVASRKSEKRRTRFVAAIRRANSSEEPYKAVKKLAEHMMRERRYHDLVDPLIQSTTEAKLLIALSQLDKVIQTRGYSQDQLNEANELLQIMAQVEDLAGLRTSTPQRPEALVQAIDIASNGIDPLHALRLIALEAPLVQGSVRLRTCKLLKDSKADSAALADVSKALVSLHQGRSINVRAVASRLNLVNADAALATFPLPKKEDLPYASPLLWNPSKIMSILASHCKEIGVSMEKKGERLDKPVPEGKRRRLQKQFPGSIDKIYTYELSVAVGDLFQDNVSGDGLSKMDATRSAWIQMLSSMHVNGILKKLFAADNKHHPATEETAADQPTDTIANPSLPRDSLLDSGAGLPLHASTAQAPAVQRDLQLLDLEHVQAICSLPSRDQYPTANRSLDEPLHASTALHIACDQAKLSLHAEVSFTKVDFGKSRLDTRPAEVTNTFYFRCDLNLSVEDIARETARGEGLTKAAARRAAWLHMLSKLHVSGALHDLIPGSKAAAATDPAPSDDAEPVESSDPIETESNEEEFDDTITISELDERVLDEEKDAKVEIYNYAAGFGAIPEFVLEEIRPGTRRARLLAKQHKKSRQPVVATFKIEALSLTASATGAGQQNAEAAAALAFKKKAEERHVLQISNEVEQSFKALNTDTAKQFLDFLKDRGVRMTLELEESVSDYVPGNQASLTSNGAQIGQTITLRTKKDARAVAYLTGALDLAKLHPALLQEFVEIVRKDNGKALKSLKTIGLEVDPESSQIMRSALAEAHLAGLPLTREALLAEVADDDDAGSNPRRKLTEHRIMRARMRLVRKQEEFDEDPGLQQLREKKQALPMSHYRRELLEMINNNLFSIVVGATGSGKTTQVPQLLFETAVRDFDGPSCNIVCTQPRRIAAMSVARRVAEERNESLRENVGYHVRFDAQPTRNAWGINYCTTGILLERMKHDPDSVLDSTSHILIDEVHERDRIIDFLMIVLKKAIRARQEQGKRVPKIVLMSATLDTELFANYFKQPDQEGDLQPAPCLNVPGRAFPVQEKYLGSIMHELIENHGAEAMTLVNADTVSKDFVEAETKFSASASQITGPKRDSVIDWKRERPSTLESADEISAKDEKEEALVPIGLLATTIAHICATTPNDGAVLAFMPGLEEIIKVQDRLTASQIFGVNFADSSKYKLCMLHSTLPKEQQQEIFETMPAGCRKIILSTNLAETSVTIPDVKYVVDTGKLRETRYDQLRRITKLQCVWESKSNSKQRMGRAGRVQDGFYYALFSKECADSMRAIGLPELLRSDLQDTCLSIASQRFNEPIASFLAQAIEPPSDKAVKAAVSSLTMINAFTKDEELTALGRVLSRLPVHPTLAKMIVLGAIFKCLDPMIALGAAAEERPLFVKPLVNRQEAAKIHATYAEGTSSDHLAHLAAFKELRRLNAEQGMNVVASRARERFLHIGAFITTNRTACQIVQVLADCGLISADTSTSTTTYGPAALNVNADNTDLIKCLLLAGSYPNLAVKLSDKGFTYRSRSEDQISMHPASVNKDTKGKDGVRHAKQTLWTFSELSRSNNGANLFQRTTTQVTPLMTLLFGGPIRLTENGKLEMDEWAPFAVQGYNNEFNTKLVLEFRKALERVLHRAYASLADEGEEGRVRGFTGDPIQEKFTQRVVEVLRGGSAEAERMKGWVEHWASAR